MTLIRTFILTTTLVLGACSGDDTTAWSRLGTHDCAGGYVPVSDPCLPVSGPEVTS